MKIAILGAGPIGLMAALAVERNGHEPVIFAKVLEQSPINKDMFLLQPLPELNNGRPDEVLHFSRLGTSVGYARKCYGDVEAPVSWDRVRWGAQPVWWLSEAYLRLYKRYEGNLVQRDVDFIVAGDIAKEYITFSTLPAQALCGDLNHTFASVQTYLSRYFVGEQDYRSKQELIYNGASSDAWFRYSYIRGWRTWEYPERPPDVDVSPNATLLVGKKVLETSCDCHSKIHRVGRWAQHRRGILNHHAFPLTTSILATEGLGKEGA